MQETGWKLVHADVFRPPAGFFGPMFLSVFIGSGVQVCVALVFGVRAPAQYVLIFLQIIMMTVSLMVFAVLGFLSPANRGGLLTTLLLLFVFMGAFGGYYSSRIYKMFQGKVGVLAGAAGGGGSVCACVCVSLRRCGQAPAHVRAHRRRGSATRSSRRSRSRAPSRRRS